MSICNFSHSSHMLYFNLVDQLALLFFDFFNHIPQIIMNHIVLEIKALVKFHFYQFNLFLRKLIHKVIIRFKWDEI